MTTIAMFTGTPIEWGIILLIVLVLFGGSKLVGLGKSMGEGIKEFKKATREEEEQGSPAAIAPAAPPPAVAAGKPEEK